MDFIIRQYISKCSECVYITSIQKNKKLFKILPGPTKWYCNHSDKFHIKDINSIPSKYPLRRKKL